MKVFISWSGNRSREAAKALHEWIPDIIQNVEPWMSKLDIDAGKRWSNEIAEQLQATKFGIICLTSDNLSKPWIMFEAGALAKTMDSNTFVCPYLIDLETTDIPAGPLDQFQAKKAIKDETLELLKSINLAMDEDSLDESRLQRLFDRGWPDLDKRLAELTPEETEVEMRNTDDMVKEILEAVRDLRRVQSEEWRELVELLHILADTIRETQKPTISKTSKANYLREGLAGFGNPPEHPQGLKTGLSLNQLSTLLGRTIADGPKDDEENK